MRLYTVALLLFSAQIGYTQASYNQLLKDARSSNLNTLEQIDSLKVISDDLKSTEFYDTLAFAQYFKAYRYYQFIGDYYSAIEFSKEAIANFNKAEYEGIRRDRCYMYIIFSYNELNLLDSCLNYYEQLFSSQISSGSESGLAVVTGIASEVFSKKGDYRSAEILLDNFISTDYFDQISSRDKADILIDLSSASLFLNKIKKAKKALSEAENYETAVNGDLSRIHVYRNQAIRIASRNKTSTGLKAINSDSTLSKLSPRQQIPIFLNLTYGLIQHEEYDLALTNAKHAYNALKATDDYSNLQHKYLVYDNLASAHFYLDSLDLASRILDEAQNILFDDKIKTNEYLTLPALIYYDQLRVLYKRLKKMKDKNIEYKARDTWAKIDTLLSQIVSSQIIEPSKINVKAQLYQNYTLGVDLFVELEDFDKVIEVLDKGKSSLLMNHYNIEENVVSEKIISNIRKLEYLAKQEKQSSLQDSILSLRSSLLFQKIKERPYNALSDLANIENSKNTFKKENSVIYHFGQDSLFRIDLFNRSIERIESNKRIRALIAQYISTLKENGNLELISYQLSKLLLGDKLIKSTNLTILPSETLNFLPFESLVVDTMSQTYFGEKCNVRYSTSLRLDKYWANMPNTRINNVNILSPEYESNSSHLSPMFTTRNGQDLNFKNLLYASAEAVALKNQLKGHLLQSKNVPKDSFIYNLRTADIFHFTGHAVLDAEDYRFSFLALGDDGNQFERIITMSEVDQATTNAQLIFLNACNTGTGEYIKGEGVFDLSRAFFRAGARSIVNALWEVDDESSKTIALSFYNYLKKGYTKSKALAQSKRDYLNSDIPEYKKHPYYWAGLVLVGNDAPLEFYKPWHERPELYISLLAALMLFGYMKYGRR